MDMWLHTILNDPKVRGSEYMPVVYYSNMRGVPLLSYTYLAKRWGWSKSRVGRFMLKAGEYGIISRVSFSSSRGSVISMCRYREMIFGDTCEELELSSIGEIIGITKAADLVDPDEGKMDISIETRVPPAHTIGKPRKALRIIPCQGVSAVYLDDDGDSEICPCAFVMLMSDGKIEPFVFATDKDIERIANKGHTGFTGFVPTK